MGDAPITPQSPSGSSVELVEEPVPSASKASVAKWSHNAIKLLDRRLSMESEFINPKSKKVKLWELTATEMQTAGYKLNSTDCHTKYHSLLQTYKFNKEKRSKTGEGKVKWEYFDTFDIVLSGKESVVPPNEIISTAISEDSSLSAEEMDPKGALVDRMKNNFSNISFNIVVFLPRFHEYYYIFIT